MYILKTTQICPVITKKRGTGYIFDENVITDMNREERESFTESFIRGSNNGTLTDDTVLPRPNTVHVTTQHTVVH